MGPLENETEALNKMPKTRLAFLKTIVKLLGNHSEDCLYMNIFVPANAGERYFLHRHICQKKVYKIITLLNVVFFSLPKATVRFQKTTCLFFRSRRDSHSNKPQNARRKHYISICDNQTISKVRSTPSILATAQAHIEELSILKSHNEDPGGPIRYFLILNNGNPMID